MVISSRMFMILLTMQNGLQGTQEMKFRSLLHRRPWPILQYDLRADQDMWYTICICIRYVPSR